MKKMTNKMFVYIESFQTKTGEVETTEYRGPYVNFKTAEKRAKAEVAKIAAPMYEDLWYAEWCTDLRSEYALRIGVLSM